MSRIVVVGAGQAGLALAARLRVLGHDGPLTLIGDEADAPYQRPPLSKKYLLGQMDRSRLALRSESFYADQAIDLVTGTPVLAVDRTRRVVQTTAGDVPYDRLALTLGATPRQLPEAAGGALAGVHTLRTVADIDRLAPEVQAEARVLVVGGGYIGLEAAAVARQRGLAVTVIEAAPRILARVAAAETSARIRSLHSRHGVTVREGIGLVHLTGDRGRVRGAELSDGSKVEVDFVVVGIGVTPNTALAVQAGLQVENGIAVDARGATSDPDIFAAGDCASFPQGGARLRLESVQNAIDQGEHVAAAMLGAEAAYAPLPWFWSDQYDQKLQIVGLGHGHDRVVTRAGHRADGWSHWYFRGAQLLAVDALGDPKAYMTAKRWMEQRHSPDPESLAAGIPLTDLGP